MNQVAFCHHERDGTVRRGSPSAGECDFSRTLLATRLSPYHCYLLLYGIDDIILILQQNRLQWYVHVLRREDTDWVKKCMKCEVEGSRSRGRPKRTWKEDVQKDCQARNLNKENAVDRSRCKKLIKIG